MLFRLYYLGFERIDDLYTVIRDAKEDGRLIVLKGPFKFPLEDDNKLIIRKADKHIFTLWKEACFGGHAIKGIKAKHLIVLGPEGVGKVITVS